MVWSQFQDLCQLDVPNHCDPQGPPLNTDNSYNSRSKDELYILAGKAASIPCTPSFLKASTLVHWRSRYLSPCFLWMEERKATQVLAYTFFLSQPKRAYSSLTIQSEAVIIHVSAVQVLRLRTNRQWVHAIHEWDLYSHRISQWPSQLH